MSRWRRAGFPLVPIILIAVSRPLSASPSSGSIVAWGIDESGECAIPAHNEGFVAISVGRDHTLGLRNDGSIEACGSNIFGQCDVPSPNSDFVAVSAGEWHSLALKEDGSIVAWGANWAGECDVPQANAHYVAISAGSSYSMALAEDGSIVAWGSNEGGRCNVPSPNTGFIAVSAGSAGCSLGLRSDGSIVVWGSAFAGQDSLPEPNSEFIAISSGDSHCLGLKADGSVVAWGANEYGQCRIPTPNTGFVAIAAGGWHSIALRADGTIATWGDHGSGQCSVPSPDQGFIAIDAGGVCGIALRTEMEELTAGSVCEGPIEGMQFAWIPTGSFEMGSPESEPGRDDDEGPVHTVNIRGFEMLTTEVTQGMWEAVMGTTVADIRTAQDPPFYPVIEGSDYPMYFVSWNDCEKFVNRLGKLDPSHEYRLPSESEWEYACRAGTSAAYYWGDSVSEDYCWYYSGNSSGRPELVGLKLPNAWGLYDMSGNVWEWCEDLYLPGYGAPSDGSPWPSPSGPVLRGGYWYGEWWLCRSASRAWDDPSNLSDGTGFRVARSLR